MRQTAPNVGPSVLAQELKRAPEGASAFVHSGQATAEHVVRRKTGTVIPYLYDKMIVIDLRFDVHRTRVSVPQNVRDAFLNDAVGGLGQDAVDVGEAAVDTGR